MNNVRRKICQSLGALLGATSLVACAQPGVKKPERSYSEEEQQRMHKFRGIWGYEFFIDGFGSTSEEGFYATLFNDQGLRLIAGRVWETGNAKTSYSIRPPGLMKTLTATAYTQRHGQPVYEVTFPVADRIPDDLLDDLRRDPKGSLRIKIRLHREGVLLGWDIERRPGFDPKKRDSYGAIAYVAPGWVKTGGDFKEARGVYWLEDEAGNLVQAPRPELLGGVMPPELARRGVVFRNGFLREKGWYIHPKTGQKIETDF